MPQLTAELLVRCESLLTGRVGDNDVFISLPFVSGDQFILVASRHLIVVSRRAVEVLTTVDGRLM